MNASDYENFLSLALPLDPPAIPLGIGAALRRLARAGGG
jgi:hypothetical protein